MGNVKSSPRTPWRFFSVADLLTGTARLVFVLSLPIVLSINYYHSLLSVLNVRVARKGASKFAPSVPLAVIS